jgi:hypothetical protein
MNVYLEVWDEKKTVITQAFHNMEYVCG